MVAQMVEHSLWIWVFGFESSYGIDNTMAVDGYAMQGLDNR